MGCTYLGAELRRYTWQGGYVFFETDHIQPIAIRCSVSDFGCGGGRVSISMSNRSLGAIKISVDVRELLDNRFFLCSGGTTSRESSSWFLEPCFAEDHDTKALPSYRQSKSVLVP